VRVTVIILVGITEVVKVLEKGGTKRIGINQVGRTVVIGSIVTEVELEVDIYGKVVGGIRLGVGGVVVERDNVVSNRIRKAGNGAIRSECSSVGIREGTVNSI
jgi:hypothetical protein